MSEKANTNKTASLIAALVLAGLSADGLAQSSPGEWLDRMTDAALVISYEGTVIRRQDGTSDTLKVVRKFIDGVINERLTTQEGNGLEIIRVGNEVHCILPDQQSVLVEEWNNQSTLFSALPTSDVRYAAQYDVSLVREDRVAGRSAVMLAIRPHDEFRFGHRIWLDQKTAFPLKTQLLDANGEIIEQVKFAEISFGESVSQNVLTPSVSIESFTWYKEPARYRKVDVESTWSSTDMPPGFRTMSTKTEIESSSELSVTHIVYSDGLADISVFISQRNDEGLTGASRMGSSNSYGAQRSDFQITAVGKVPASAVQRIATSMQRQ
jgi:sigma-E factor negative regulatory protein RseB